MPEPSPQLEDGYTRIANEFLEALACADYPASTLRFLLIVMRETWGWQKKQAKIPASRFAEAFGVTERRVRQIREDCLRHNLIEVESGDQFDTPIYRIQKRYTDWMVWKTNNPWEYKPTRKTNIPSFPEDEHTEHPEGEPSTTINGKDSLKDNQRNGDSSRGKRLGETGDLPYMKLEYGNLYAACQKLPWTGDIPLRWFEDIIAAIESESDAWIDDDFQAAELLRQYPPKGAEKNLPSKWLERVEREVAAQQPTPRSSYEAALAEVEALANARFADLPEPASTRNEGVRESD